MNEVEEIVLAAAGTGAVARRLDGAQPRTEVLREEHASVILAVRARKAMVKRRPEKVGGQEIVGRSRAVRRRNLAKVRR